MNRKKEIKDELKDIAPFLSKIDKKPGFKVPHNYFEQLPDEIMKGLELKTKQQPERTISWWEQSLQVFLTAFQPRVVMALASIALIIGSFFYLNQTENSSESNIAADQYLAYINDNIDDFDEEMILELSMNDNIELDDFSNTTIDEQALDDYLEEVIDELDDSSIEDLL